jgi:hypothetical protein
MTDINANVTTCLVTKNHVGYDTYVNICSGVSKDVPWTALDWLSAGCTAALVVLLVGIFVGLIWLAIDGIRHPY